MKKQDKNKQAQPVNRTESELKIHALEVAELEAKQQQENPLSPRKKKIDNYLYHYKWHTVASVVALFLVVFFLKDTVFKTKPDATIIMLSRRYFAQETLDELKLEIEKYSPDLNNDGKILIEINYINLPQTAQVGDSNAQSANPIIDSGTEYATTMKLVATVAAEEDSLYLMDDYDENYRPKDGSLAENIYDIFRSSANDLVAGISLADTVLAGTPVANELGAMSFYISDRKSEGKNPKTYGRYGFLLDSLRQ